MSDETLEQALDHMRNCICAGAPFDGYSTNGSIEDDYDGGGRWTLSPLSAFGAAATSASWRLATATDSSPLAAADGDACSDVTMTFDAPSPSANVHFRNIEEILNSRIAVAVCIFGLIGNIGNLIVLLPQGRHCSMGRIERFAYCGLVALTVSDGLFCLTVIPQSFVEQNAVVHRLDDFRLLYAVYGNALVNVFSMASTWLTVTLAVGRYLAICHPFRAREVIGTTVAKRAIFVVYAACVVFNIPRFLTYGVERISCGDSMELYFQWPGETHVKRRPELERIYMWLYFVFGIGVPFVCLVFSNVFLVRALRVACVRLQSIRAVDVCNLHQYRPITMTLVALVAMHIVLVSPAEFALFLRQMLARTVLPVRLYGCFVARTAFCRVGRLRCCAVAAKHEFEGWSINKHDGTPNNIAHSGE